MDEFKIWLDNNKNHCALVDKSYKNVCQQKKGVDPNDIKVNTELATYGDAVLKLALCQILWCEDVSMLTEKKKKYEEDETLVKAIADYYDLLDYIKYDKKTKPSDYEYEKKHGKNPHKFIATAVEACLGAIYLENKSIDVVLEIVNVWKNLIDYSDNN